MGFLTDLGKFAGKVTGGVIGGTVSLIGDIVDSKTIREIGEGAYRVTAHTGETIGRFADGAVMCASGAIGKDASKMSSGAKEIGNVAVETVNGIGKGIVNTASLGINGVGAVLDGDADKVIEIGKKFVKVAAIGALSFSVLDAIDGVMDGSILDADHDGVPDFLERNDAHLADNPNMHHVTPHERHFADGSSTWVDGDKDPTVNTYDGWYQHNPDYRA